MIVNDKKGFLHPPGSGHCIMEGWQFSVGKLELVSLIFIIFLISYNTYRLNKHFKEITDLKLMVEKSDLSKLTKSQLIERIEKLENKTVKERWMNYISTIVAIVLGIIVIFTTVLPSFSGIIVRYGGKNIDLINTTSGTWEINFVTTGFIPTNNIVLHVKFLDNLAEVNYESLFFSVTPDIKKLEKQHEFEYKWNSYKGEIEIIVEIKSNATLLNNTYVQISTDRGLEYEYWGIEGLNDSISFLSDIL